MTKPSKVLVTGATGTQGGAVARLLLERGYALRAVTRRPDSPAARALSARGVEVVAGDLTDRDAMDAAFRGVDAAFSVGTPFEVGTAAETQQGVTVADAAKAAGAFLLYSSVANADRHTHIPHFDSKLEVEKHIRAIGVEATILAPAYFMENVRFSRTQLRDHMVPSPLSPTRKLAQIAVQDVAAAAVAVFENRARHAGKRYDLAGDELSGEDSVRILSAVTGRSFRYVQLPLDVIRQGMGEDGVKMYEWFARVGYTYDRDALARELPEVGWTSFETWARRFDWNAFLAA